MLVIIPIALTLLVLGFVINKLDQVMAPAVTWLIQYFKLPLPDDFHLPGLGLFLIVLIIFMIGLGGANFFGKQLLRLWDGLVHRVPVARGVYATLKNVVDTLSRSDTPTFNELVLVRYPHQSSRMIGLVSCQGRGEVVSRTGEDLVNVFLPLLPNVTLGFMLVVPRDQLITLKMTREEGIKYLMSFGIAVPGKDTEKSGTA